MRHFNLFVVLALCATVLATAAEVPPPETKAEHDARMAWFREARFGMFIHWGLYAVPAGEWNGKTGYAEWFLEETKIPVSEYAKFIPQFNPVKFDAKEWVRIAKDAGMKYIVITSKHHDGFCMFPSKLTDWCISSTPFKRDPLAELSAACKEAGIRFCTYHSIMDWHHPDWGTRRAWNDTATGTPDMERFTEYLKGQLKEIVTNYHPGIMWFDGEWEKPWTHERGVDLYAYLRKLDPELIINNRIDKFRSGMAGMNNNNAAVGDYGTPEQEIPPTGFGPGVDWESCMTLNNHWGYNKNDHNWKSTETIVRNLVDIASKGGNYLLNVGPTAEGLIPAPSVERLAEVGAWMKVNGESIYGTTASPFKKLSWGRATQKPGKLYLHVFNWPTNGSLQVPMNATVTAARLLAKPGELVVTSNDDGVSIAVGGTAPEAIDSVVELSVTGEIQPLAGGIRQAADGTIALTADSADTRGSTIKMESAHNNLGFWSSENDTASWQVKVTQPGSFNVSLDYALSPKGNGNRFALAADDQPLTAALTATKGWEDYTTVSVGILTIAKAGVVTISVKPVGKPSEGLMNLRTIALTPAAK